MCSTGFFYTKKIHIKLYQNVFILYILVFLTFCFRRFPQFQPVKKLGFMQQGIAVEKTICCKKP